MRFFEVVPWSYIHWRVMLGLGIPQHNFSGNNAMSDILSSCWVCIQDYPSRNDKDIMFRHNMAEDQWKIICFSCRRSQVQTPESLGRARTETCLKFWKVAASQYRHHWTKWTSSLTQGKAASCVISSYVLFNVALPFSGFHSQLSLNLGQSTQGQSSDECTEIFLVKS